MVEVVQEGRRRSLAKAVSWRALGSADTFVLSWVITGSPLAAGSIATAETFTKVVLYYLHERAWSLSFWGRKAPAAPATLANRSVAAPKTTALAPRRSDVRSHNARRGRSRLPERRALATLAPASRLPVAAGPSPTGANVVALPVTAVAPNRAAPPRPKAGLWLPAKIGIVGALCTYLALTFGPAMLEPAGLQVPGSDLADTRSQQSASDEGQVRLAQYRPDTAPAGQPSDPAGPSATDAQPEASAVVQPAPVREADAALPPQRPAPAAAEPQHDLSVAEHVEEVQRRLTRYGYLPAAPTGVWGPMSRQALRTFKAVHDLAQDDSWDQATERALFSPNVKPADSFVGIWGADSTACSAQGGRKGLLPAVIDSQGAMAGETFCAFKDRVKTNEGWTFTASCTSPRERWTTKVRLETNGNKLIWASQRGTQTYTRCERRLITADMTPTRSR